MTADVVWYAPEHKAAALALVRHLSSAEIARRGLDPHLRGLRFNFNALIPNAQGYGFRRGFCVMTNQLGTASFPAGRVGSDGRIHLWDMVNVLEMGEGFCAANWREDIWSLPEVREFILWHETAEDAARKAKRKADSAAFLEEAAEAAEAVRRFCDVAAILGETGAWWRRWRAMRRAKAVVFSGPLAFQELEKFLRRFEEREEEDEEPPADVCPEEYAARILGENVDKVSKRTPVRVP